ncbi:hypothetical protein NECAME_09634 [Necator americanus]|uniref:Neuropeptide-like protein 31 family protein n=1 Tax=Necator americanus TaxID=51031 RepID=W2TFJ3_NECAM|nr:hypothetical protein NECAME_09634 [Necator americanus]ETN79767.1 hypothetical protein NECAME_09634 [Necator americanus]
MNYFTAFLLLCSLTALIHCSPVPDSDQKAANTRINRVKRWGYGYGGYGGYGGYPGGGYYPGGGGFYPGGGGGAFGNSWGRSISLNTNLRLGGFNNGYSMFGR